MMQPIIEPVARELLLAELTADKFLRKTNYGEREIYVVTQQNAPNVMRELGRLREWSFRASGGGTGKELDIDEFDTDEVSPFRQLLVWCPEDQEIVGGYRFLDGKAMGRYANGHLKSPTAELFDFSDHFIQDYLPHSVELGRSFIQPNYQFSNTESARKNLFSLDNLWDGLGAILMHLPETRYFFGKVTMYPRFNILARDLILYFMSLYFPDKELLLIPRYPVQTMMSPEELSVIFKGDSYKEDYKILIKELKAYNETIPPLINAYMNLSPTMKSFGTSVNKGFGEVEETGILITIADIYEAKKDRHL